ncbi:MAG: queuosine precursor transporter [Deltaproteobacteria bacterium]|nr:queuosine precursor transporter [Deltaproteobacteria bacterium]
MDNQSSFTSTPFDVSIWYIVVVSVFITCLITANIMAVKIISLFGLILPAAIIIFPMSYIAGDVLTEVYGYQHTRRAIWLGFFCNLITVLALWLGQLLPAASFWEGQESYERILGYTPRLLVASFFAYLVGGFANSFIMARMKIMTQGQFLWTRTIGSTLVGQGLDSMLFITLAFVGTIPWSALGLAVVTQWLVKSSYEAIATPLTYAVVGFLKKKEGLEIFDHRTRFSPFSFQVGQDRQI